jgi:hypothetical protein
MSELFEYELVIRVMTDRNATVAHIVSECMCHVLASGSAKRMPGETFSENVGIDLAVSRALREYASVLEEAALKAIESN